MELPELDMPTEDEAREAQWDDIVTALMDGGDLDREAANYVTRLLINNEIPHISVRELA